MTINVARSPSSGRLKLILPDQVERRDSIMDRSKKYKTGGGPRELPRHTWSLMCSLIFMLVLGFVMTMSLSLPVKVRTTDPKTGKKVEKWIFRNSIRGCVGFPCPMDPDALEHMEVIETLKGKVGNDSKRGQWRPGDVKNKDGKGPSDFYVDKFGDMRRKSGSKAGLTWDTKTAAKGKASSEKNYFGAPSNSKDAWQKSQQPVGGGSSLKRQFNHQNPPQRGQIKHAPPVTHSKQARKFVAKVKDNKHQSGKSKSKQQRPGPHGHSMKKHAAHNAGKQAANQHTVTLPDSDGNGVPDQYQNQQPQPQHTVTLPDKNNNGIPDKFDKNAAPSPDAPQGAPSDTTQPPQPSTEAASGQAPPSSPNPSQPDLKRDTDKDGVPDFLEQGANKDSNKDGKPDRLQGPNAPTATSSFDKDADGVPDKYEVGPNKDDNGNGIPDRLETGAGAKGGEQKKEEQPQQQQQQSPQSQEQQPKQEQQGGAAPQGGSVTLPDTNGNGVPDKYEGGAAQQPSQSAPS